MKTKVYLFSSVFVLVGLFAVLAGVPKAQAGYWGEQDVSVECSVKASIAEVQIGAYDGNGDYDPATADEAVQRWNELQQSYSSPYGDDFNPWSGDNSWEWRLTGALSYYNFGGGKGGRVIGGPKECEEQFPGLENVTEYTLLLWNGPVDDGGWTIDWWIAWTVITKESTYIPTPPAMDILVNGQSPTGQVAKTGTRPLYDYATGCWNWESNHWKLLKQTNRSFACSSYPGSYFLQYLYGEIGTETYTYYV